MNCVRIGCKTKLFTFEFGYMDLVGRDERVPKETGASFYKNSPFPEMWVEPTETGLCSARCIIRALYRLTQGWILQLRIEDPASTRGKGNRKPIIRSYKARSKLSADIFHNIRQGRGSYIEILSDPEYTPGYDNPEEIFLDTLCAYQKLNLHRFLTFHFFMYLLKKIIITIIIFSLFFDLPSCYFPPS